MESKASAAAAAAVAAAAACASRRPPVHQSRGDMLLPLLRLL